MHRICQVTIGKAIVAASAGSGFAVEVPHFISIEQPTKDSVESRPRGITSDGTTVFGHTVVGSSRVAFRWIRENGARVARDKFGQPLIHSEARAAGGVMVAVVHPTFGDDRRTLLWAGDEAPLELAVESSVPVSVSSDGTAVVGNAVAGAFRWTESGGTEALGDFVAVGASADALVVAGTLPGGGIARWTRDGGLVDLGFPGGRAWAISADGSTIAAWDAGEAAILIRDGGSTRAFDDTQYRVRIEGLSRDGSVVIGMSLTESGFDDHSVVWSQTYGTWDLRNYLYFLFNLGWNYEIFSVKGISADGRTLVGQGAPSDGFRGEAWLAFLGSGCGTPGDISQNGEVGLSDLAQLLANFDHRSATQFQGDIDWDGRVGFSDLTILLQHYGTRCPE